ncbi:PREDICTED: olfactory receptor 14J1-like [Chrysochloris asiatica]|uniref:Olfactory receptor n=1 Tax=Chrysochloris asiatica TaxID=185453 RepID=A0A9B0TYW0_CHRAS|nr:PREDICTED: olfactory receptor 14J1-like [Chrysochloris asiatica]
MIIVNLTALSGFLLMGFSDIRELQILHGLLFLAVYLLTLAGNLIIIIITTVDEHLQAPMYYFLKQLSLLNLSFITVTVPQSIDNSLMDDGYISQGQCILQVFFFKSLAWSEMAILTVMSYDRYAAICFPLHYEVIMNPRTCQRAVIAIWLNGNISGILFTTTKFSITFCKPKIIHQFFCDIPQLLKLSCSDDYLRVIGVTTFLPVLGFIGFISIVLSYIQFFSTVLRIPSTEGRSKAFSTCLPHLFVVAFYVFTGMFAFLKPTSDSPTAFDLMISIFYTVTPPTLNPVIYSLRNEGMKEAFRKLLLGGQFTRKKKFCALVDTSFLLPVSKILNNIEFIQ